MTESDMRILVIADDDESVAELLRHIVHALNADVTLVNSLDDLEELQQLERFDVVLVRHGYFDDRTAHTLDDGDRTRPPVIVFDGDPDVDRLLQALRQGAADVIPAPVDLDDLAEGVQRVVRQGRIHRGEAVRSRRLRNMSSQLIKERRELRKRIDLICHDIVDAYRRLAEQVVSGSNRTEIDKPSLQSRN